MMREDPTHHHLSERIARLEGEPKAATAENNAMESRIDARLAGMEAEAAKRDKDNLRWQIGLWVAAVVIIGVLIRWPAS